MGDTEKKCEFQTDDAASVSLVQSYCWSPRKTFTFLTLSALSFGFFPLALALLKDGIAEFVRWTHDQCPLEKVTVFLVKVTFHKNSVICQPVLIVHEKHGPPPGRRFHTLTPLNRCLLSFWRQILSRFAINGLNIEFTKEEEFALPFRVHADSVENSLQAGIDIPVCGTYFWNPDRQVFQHLETPPPYFSRSLGRLPDLVDRHSQGSHEDFAAACQRDVDVFQQELTANDAPFVIELYRSNFLKTFMYTLLSIFSCGLVPAICSWKPAWRLVLTCDRLDFANSPFATCVKIVDTALSGNVWIRPLWLATHRGVLIDDSDFTSPAPLGKLPASPTNNRPWHLVWRFFVFESAPLVLDIKSNRFKPGSSILEDMTTSRGAVDCHPWARRILSGFNVMPVPLTPLWLILWRELFSPFYVFQIACCIGWLILEYTIYASCLLVFAALTICWLVFMTYTNERAVWRTVVGDEESSDDSRVSIAEQENMLDNNIRYQPTISVKPKNLVPGDFVFLEQKPTGQMPQIPADLVLVKGSCLVDESMLSGEVTPVHKFACANPFGFGKRHEKPIERNLLHSGTKLLLLSPGTVAVVTAVGFSTTRGRLVRAVLRPTKVDIRFTIETMRFIGALAVLGIIGLIYNATIRVIRREEALVIIVMCLILVSVIVPPQISVGLSISLVVAQLRLKGKKIFCTNPKSITPTGSVDLICFDKTGTLTEESVRLSSVTGVKKDDETGVLFTPNFVPNEFELCAACCNAVTLFPQSLHEEANSSTTPVGDPIDVELLRFSNFSLIATGLYFSNSKPGLKIEIIKNFGFSPERRSACVIAKVSDPIQQSIYAFVKGAPEQLLARCLSWTIPANIDQIINDATQKGLRLIVLASRIILESDSQSLENMDQDVIETELELDGIAFFENSVKPESRPTVAKLRRANLRMLIVTGDDVRTAVSTAKQCGFISDAEEVVMVQETAEQAKVHHNDICVDSFIQLCTVIDGPSVATVLDHQAIHLKTLAITESAWEALKFAASNHVIGASAAFKLLLDQCVVYARFRPDQKADVVEEFKKRFGFIVAMVGDGANDCCALKAADVGIALTEAEASVASAFTCKIRNVSPVVDILKEGRCSLVSTFGLFSVLISYSLVQFTSMCILYWVQANFPDLHFLYIDLFLLTTLSFAFPLVPSFNAALSIERPHRHLLCFGQVAPIICHNAINIAFQVFAFTYVQEQPWFLPYITKPDSSFTRLYNSFEVYAVYCVSIFQYIWSAIIFSQGAPFRSRFYRSRVFTAHLVVLLVINHFIVIFLPDAIRVAFKLFPVPSLEFRILLILIAYINFGCCFLFVRGVQEFPIDFLLSKLKKLLSSN